MINPYYINSIIGVEWSIPVEMMFYLCLPLIFLKVNNLKKSFLLFLLSILGLFILQSILSHFVFASPSRLWTEFLLFWFPAQLPVFSLGILLFFLIFKTDFLIAINARCFEEKEKPIISAILFLLMVVYLAVFLFNLPIIPDYVKFSLGFSLFIFGLSIYPLRLFVNKFWSFLGKISYSCYLMHMVVLTLIGTYLMGIITQYISNTYAIFAVTYMCVITGTVLVSVITHKYIETPGILLGKKIIGLIESKCRG